ncbi:hypothetical protein LV84_03227 [Algoriphagus ratkowskyi]|uniref:Uncharacterized protein n=1 Tax=Algoriphagus ratkowskyi TaxID=57028 RepID=A0A2W7QY97_9BACT|nr:hypothetical protein [Algoriphagus ratkowskyi]PZX53503.1 hypothetical protein LV84_03227 [Algoriphagus ratkowskyi]
MEDHDLCIDELESYMVTDHFFLYQPILPIAEKEPDRAQNESSREME